MLAEKKRSEDEPKVTSFPRTPVIQINDYHVSSTPIPAYEMERDFQVLRKKYEPARESMNDAATDSTNKPDFSMVEQCLLSVPYFSSMVAKDRKREIFSNTRQKAVNEMKKILEKKQKDEKKASDDYLSSLSLQVDLINRLRLIIENGVFDEDGEFERTVDGTITFVDYQTLRHQLATIMEETKEAKEEYEKIRVARKETKNVIKRIGVTSDHKEYLQVLASCKNKLGLTENQFRDIADDTVDDARDVADLFDGIAETNQNAHVAVESVFESGETETDMLLEKFKKQAINRKTIRSMPSISSKSNDKGPKPPPYDGAMLLNEDPKPVKVNERRLSESSTEADLAVL